MSNYPIGKAVPPPSSGGGAAPNYGPPGGAPGGWQPPSNAWSGSGNWAPPTGAWAPPTGAWSASGGYPGGASSGYPGGAGGGYPSGGGYPGGGYPGGGYPGGAGSGYPGGAGGGYPGAAYPNPTMGGGGYPPAPGTVYPSGPASYPLQPSNIPGPYPGPPGSNYPPGPGAYPSNPPSYPGGNVYPSAPSSGNVYPPPSQPNAFPSPLQPGYQPYPGGSQPLAPTVTPQSNPIFSSGGYEGAIQFFKSMSDKDIIPDEGRMFFIALAGIDGAIDAFELEDILNKVFLSEFKFNGFSSDMTRSLVAMRDYDISGKLGFEDFRKLWTDLAWCKRTFVMLDVNKSGAFCKTEFAKAMETLGLTVPPRVQQAMIMRYSDQEGNVRFDDFVLCYIRLKTMMTTYQGKDPQHQGVTEFERDEFVQLAIYS